MTRQDYLDKKCTHAEYYAQFVDDGIRALVLDRFGLEAIKAHCSASMGDPGYIPVTKWDSLAPCVPDHALTKICNIGQDKYPDSLCTRVCILKMAAQQIAEWSK